MKNNKIGMVLIIIAFLLMPINMFIPVVISDPIENKPYDYWYAPENTMGIKEMKTVNWNYFKQLFLSHTDWSLEYKRYVTSSWMDGSNYLTIERTWNDSGFWKFNLILDVPVYIYSARFTFGIDLSCLQYVQRDGYKVWINYTANETEIYSCVFDWSDIATIPNIIITKGVTNDMFWFRFKKDSIPSGHYEFDPTFGSSVEHLSTNIPNNELMGTFDTVTGGDGTVDNITLKTGAWQSGEKIKCALYTEGGSLLATTEERNTGGTGWFVFDFLSPPSVTNNSRYLILGTSDSTVYMYYGADSGKARYRNDPNVYEDGYPADMDWDGGNLSNWAFAIYCSYTVDSGWSNTCSVSSSENPTNKSVDVAVDVGFWNVTINDADGNNTWGNITCNNSDTTPWSNQPNGIKSLTLSTLDYSTNYTVWLNFTDGHCAVNETYWFITETFEWSNTCPVSSSESPTNKSTGVSIDVGYWNVTINDDDGNNTYGNLTCSNSDTTPWSNQANGTKSLTLSTLSGSTNYTIWLNFTDGHCNVNETYWFITETLWSNTCPVSSSKSPTNKSINVSIDVGYWNVTINDIDANNTWGDITCSNGASVSWSNQANGTKSLDLSEVQYYQEIPYQDGFTAYSNPDSTYCVQGETIVGDGTHWSDKSKGYEEWDLSTIPSDAIITDAYFKVYWRSTYASSFGDYMNIYRLNQSWSCPTWNNAPTYNDKVYATLYCNGTTQWSDNVNVTSLVREWVNGTFTNYGMCIWRNTGINQYGFASEDYNINPNYRLYLNVTYIPIIDYDTNYTVWLNFTDGNCDVNETYWFSTAEIPNAFPQISDEYPTNNSINMYLFPILGITVNDADGDNMSITWYSNVSGSWQKIGSVLSNVGNGTYFQKFDEIGIYGLTYYWNVSVTDGINTTDSEIYSFTAEHIPTIPVGNGVGNGEIGIMGLFGFLGFLLGKRAYNSNNGKKDK